MPNHPRRFTETTLHVAQVSEAEIAQIEQSEKVLIYSVVQKLVTLVQNENHLFAQSIKDSVDTNSINTTDSAQYGTISTNTTTSNNQEPNNTVLLRKGLSVQVLYFDRTGMRILIKHEDAVYWVTSSDIRQTVTFSIYKLKLCRAK
jgi:hypothetical protein